MNGIIDKFKMSPYLFTLEYDSGGGVGGEITVYVNLIGSQDSILHRTFYFNKNEKHIRSFARKFVNDPAYRQECLAQTVHWAHSGRWYAQNDHIYYDQFQTIKVAHTKEEHRRMEAQFQQTQARLEQLYRIIDTQVEKFEDTKEYQEHLVIEQSFTPSIAVLDHEIAGIIQLLNQLPGVVTQFSCQGIRRGIQVEEWKYGPIWFPGNHQPLAYVSFDQIPPVLENKLDAHFRKLGLGLVKFKRISSNLPQNNAKFIAALEKFIKSESETALVF